MSRRFRPSDAFVDESIRGQRYLMGCVLVEARHLAVVRRTTLDLVAPGKRLHFHQELDMVRRNALEVFASMPIRVDAVIAVRGHRVTEFAARAACLARIVDDLQAQEVTRLTIESRQDDRDDVRTIVRCRRPEPSLVFDHREGLLEPVLWIADAVVWALGAGGAWPQHLTGILGAVIELRP